MFPRPQSRKCLFHITHFIGLSVEKKGYVWPIHGWPRSQCRKLPLNFILSLLWLTLILLEAFISFEILFYVR